MKTTPLLIGLLSLALSCVVAAEKIYEVVLENITEGPRTLSVVFRNPLPSPEVVDALIRESLQSAVKIRGERDILELDLSEMM